MSASTPSPVIIRSQRNQQLKTAHPAARDVFELQEQNHGTGNNTPAHSPAPAHLLDSLANTRLQLPHPEDHLGYFSTSALILNKMIGTGIFVTPATILVITGSKGASIILWMVGGLVTWSGLAVYMEYGIRFPLTGGELYYIDYVWQRPKLLFTYMYSIMYVFLSGSHANALVFGGAVLTAATPAGTIVDQRLQKLFAVLLVGIICQLQTFSRINYVRFSNVFAVYKFSFLSFITVAGFCALGNRRSATAAATNTLYGTENLQSDFEGSSRQPYAIALALLDIMRVYSGYENANFVLEEVRRPPGDETRVFRRGAKVTILLVTFFYITVNIAFFAACSSDELAKNSDTLSLFFTKVFGPSARTRTASGTLLAISSAGNIMSATFAAVRVKQEIARLGILPYPEFFAKSTRRGTPGPALLIHFVFSTVFIIAAPLSNANGYLVISTIFNYARTLVAVLLGVALLFAPRLKSFSFDNQPWSPHGTRLGLWMLYPLTMVYILVNLFVFVVSWLPSNLQTTLHTNAQVLSSFVGPTVAMSCFAIGAIYWVWDSKVLNAVGYRMEPLAERQEGATVYMAFERHIKADSPAAVVYIAFTRTVEKLRRFRRSSII